VGRTLIIRYLVKTDPLFRITFSEAGKKTILAGLFITLTTLLAYWNIQYNNLISYDDVKYLLNNEQVRSGLSPESIRWALTATYDANWFPLTWLSHMLDMSLFGSNPLGHHLENLFLHIANALLLMGLLSRLTGQIWRSAAVALLFALHPLHVESVAWIAERKDVLSTLFFMLTIRYYINYAKRDSSVAYWLALLFYLCGLATKPMLVSLPFILLLLDFWPLRRTAADLRALLREKAPFALSAAISCIVTYTVQKNGGASLDAIDSSFIENCLHALCNYLTYLRKIFCPVDLGVIYPYVKELPFLMLAGAVVILAGLTVTAFLFRQRLPYITTGWFWFLITTAPVAGFVRIGAHSVADRYTYIPSIGIFIAAVWLLSELLSEKRYGKIIATLVALAVMTPLAAATWKQTTYWKESITLFEHTLAVTENNWVAHGNLGAELLAYNRLEEATWHIREAVRINPDSYSARYNLGLILNRLGDKPGALNAFQNVIRVRPAESGAYFEAGRICYELGDSASAYKIHAALMQINTDLAGALGRYFTLLDSANPTPGR
jgi:tetratricopeptide (TPR) repeat protein